ncbi:MAG TPA: glycosyltransferase [Phycisphaerae bacterium]|nr:glycosyltransferase [Phycisphaerae bacterium]
MKVAIVLDSLVRGGAERQALYALGEMTRQGRDVELLYYNEAKYAYPPDFGGGGRVTRIEKRGQYLRFLGRLIKKFRQERYDVVHGFVPGSSIYAVLAAWIARVPVIFGGVRAEYDMGGLVRLSHRVVDQLATGWIVNSQATVRSMLPAIGATPDRIHVVYNGIDPAVFRSNLSAAEAKRKLGIAEYSPVITVLARLEPQKNIALFLRAAVATHAVRSQTRFLIAGDGSLRGELQRQCHELGLDGIMQFLGNRPDVADVLRATDLLALTSTYEGLSNTLLEAMSVGLPVVSTAYLGIDELIRDGEQGFVVPLNDCDALVRRFVQLLDDPSLRSSMGQAGNDTVLRRFTIAGMAARLYEVYGEAFARVANRRSMEPKVA